MVEKDRKPLQEGVEKGATKPGPKKPEPQVAPPPQKRQSNESPQDKK